MKKVCILIVAFAIASMSCRSTAQIANTGDVSKASLPITKLHIPQPWLQDREGFYIRQIEVRKVPNSSDGDFFLRALPDGEHDYAHEVDKKLHPPRYGKNVFAVNFSGNLRVRTATQQEWESGSRVPTHSRHVFPKENTTPEKEIEYRRKRYSKTGEHWGVSGLSPTGRWLAVFSYNGQEPPPSLFDFLGAGEPPVGDVFWQVYDTVTGEKVFEWEAKNVKRPRSFDGPVVWLEERYFLFPEDERARNFNVVKLPPFTPEVNPVTIQFPSRKDATGRWLPAGVTDEVWIPLVPLTQEQAAKLTAVMETVIKEFRVLGQPIARELLMAIDEETETRRFTRPGGDGSGDYHFRLISTYYYAVSLDNPAQTRLARKEEWDQSRTANSGRSEPTAPPITETVTGTLSPFRQFAKTGTTWGSPSILSAGEWIAVFSYNDDTQPAGKMFVDIYDHRLGHKLMSTELSSSIAPNEAFKRALFVEGGYILLPLNPSLDSFALWQLP